MLQKETISQDTLELLIRLMRDKELSGFFLVGGTALSLQIGHRISIDIDLFSIAPYDENFLLQSLENRYEFQLDYQAKNTLKGQINNVKVDLITHAYPLVQPLFEHEGVRIANIQDIAAMKLNAIAGNGTRLKDFIDIAYLSSYLPLNDMLNAYMEKYLTRNPIIVLKALDYHEDIDFNEPIKMLKEDYSWNTIKNKLSQMISHPDVIFS